MKQNTKHFQSPKNRSLTIKKAKLRLSSAETFQKIYDNKTYKHQLIKLFDPLTALKDFPKRHSPSNLLYNNIH